VTADAQCSDEIVRALLIVKIYILIMFLFPRHLCGVCDEFREEIELTRAVQFGSFRSPKGNPLSWFSVANYPFLSHRVGLAGAALPF